MKALPGSDGDSNMLSRASVLSLAFLWCKGDAHTQAELFCSFLNPPAETSQTDSVITCSNKRWRICLDTLVEVATISIPSAFSDFMMRKEIKKRETKLNESGVKKVDLGTDVSILASNAATTLKLHQRGSSFGSQATYGTEFELSEQTCPFPDSGEPVVEEMSEIDIEMH